MGYVPGGYRVYGGKIATRHSAFLARIERRMRSEIVEVIREFDPTLAGGRLSQLKLGEVKNFGTLVGDAQAQRVPIFDVANIFPSDRKSAWKAFSDIADRVIARTGNANG